MNQTPTGHEPPDQLDEEYRRLTAHDATTPSEQVRKSVHAYAARLARERAIEERSARRRPAWRGALFGTLAAAAIAGLMIAPRFMSLRAPRAIPVAADASAPATAGAPQAAPPLGAVEPAPASPAPEPQVAKAAPSNVRALTSPAPERAVRSENAAPAAAQADVAERSEQRALAGITTQETVATSQSAPVAGAANSARVAPPARAQPDAQANLGGGLRDAAARGDVTSARGYLQEGADVNSRDGAGRTALLRACLGGHAQVVRLLLDFGADPNLADSRGVTPLKVAEAGGEPDITAMLRVQGAH